MQINMHQILTLIQLPTPPKNAPRSGPSFKISIARNPKLPKPGGPKAMPTSTPPSVHVRFLTFPLKPSRIPIVDNF